MVSLAWHGRLVIKKNLISNEGEGYRDVTNQSVL